MIDGFSVGSWDGKDCRTVGFLVGVDETVGGSNVGITLSDGF